LRRRKHQLRDFFNRHAWFQQSSWIQGMTRSTVGAHSHDSD
jgi:hypothetical protein